MRLAAVDRGHAPEQAAALDALRERFGTEPMGVQKTLRYRPEIFGAPFSDALQLALRGPSDWSPGERELFAAFASLLNSATSERAPTARSRRTHSARRSGRRSHPTGAPRRSRRSYARRSGSSRR